MRDSQIAAIFKASETTVRRWRRIGVANGVECPLHDPVKMVEWWQKMVAVGALEKSCPPAIEAAAARVSAAMPPAHDAGESSAPKLEPDDEIAALLASIEGGKPFDYADGLKIAERSVQVADLLLLKAIRANDEKRIGPLQKRLHEAGDAYRALMRDRARIQADAGDTLSKDEVREALLEIHGNIQARIRREFKSAYPDFEKCTASAEAWHQLVDEVVDRCCRRLRETKFAAPEGG